MTRRKTVCIDDSDIHKMKKYGVVSFDSNVTIKYVKEKICPGIEVTGGIIE
jgi:hypothetical protein